MKRFALRTIQGLIEGTAFNVIAVDSAGAYPATQAECLAIPYSEYHARGFDGVKWRYTYPADAQLVAPRLEACYWDGTHQMDNMAFWIFLAIFIISAIAQVSSPSISPLSLQLPTPPYISLHLPASPSCMCTPPPTAHC